MHEDKAIRSNTIGILTVFYAVISIAIKDITVFPNTGTAEFRIGIFIPALAAIVFGPFNGAIIAGVGNIFIDVYSVLSGDITQFDTSRLLGALSNFIGAYFTGWVAKKIRRTRGEYETLINWRFIIPYTMASILGLALVTGISIGYIVVYHYLHLPFDISMSIALTIFFYNSIVIIVFIPLSLLTYWVLSKVKIIMFKIHDNRNRNLSIFKAIEDIKVQNVILPEHSIWNNQWTPLTVKIKNNLGKNHKFVFETVGNCNIYPSMDNSPIINPNHEFTQTFYVMPRNEKMIKLRCLIHTDDKIKFKQQYSKKSIININATATSTRDTDSLTQFSSVNIIVFIISILWNNVYSLINKGFSNISQIGNFTIIFIIIELILFIPFIIMLYLRLKKLSTNLLDFPVSFITDNSSYKISDYEPNNVVENNKVLIIIQLFIRVSIFILISILLYHSYLTVYLQQNGVINNYVNIFIALIIVLTFISELVMYLFIKDEVKENDLKPNEVLLSITTRKSFKINESNEALLVLTNPTDMKGIRVQLQGRDTISPNRVELHINKNEIAMVKVNIIPTYIGLTELLLIVSPLYDKNGNYLDKNEVEPIFTQRVDYVTLSETIFGMTEEQFDTLKKIAAFGTILAGGLLTISNYIGIEDVILTFRDSIPILSIIQIPFIYAYFNFSNRFKRKFAK